MTAPAIDQQSQPKPVPGAPGGPIPVAQRRRSLGTPLGYLTAVVVSVFALAPLLYVLIGGFRTTGQLAAHPLALPHPWQLDNYTGVLGSGSFWREVANSLLIA